MRRSYLSPTVNSNWNIWREFDDMIEASLPKKAMSPQVELKENEKGYLFSFDVPGMKEDDIKIEFHDSVLRIYGERKSEHKNEKDGTFHTEKYYGHFERTFRIPEAVDEANVGAHYENGVLQVFLPKTPAKESKKIEIKKGENSFSKLFSEKKSEDSH